METHYVNPFLEVHVLWPASITLNHPNHGRFMPLPSQVIYCYPMLKTTTPSKDPRLNTPSPHMRSQITPHPQGSS